MGGGDRGCAVHRVHRAGAAGVGESYAYTLRKDSGNTSLTVTNNNVQFGSDTTNEAEFAKLAKMTLQVVTSAGAQANRHSGQIEYEEIP